MRIGMLLAFIATGAAGFRACLDGSSKNPYVGAGPARSHCTGGSAYIGAIQVKADALRELLYRLLAEAGICAGGAGLGAAVALLYAAQQRVCGAAPNMGMRADHFANLHWELHWFEAMSFRPWERTETNLVGSGSDETLARRKEFAVFQSECSKWPNMNATAWRSVRRVPRAAMVEIAGKRMRAGSGATPRPGKTLTGEGDPPHRPRKHASSAEPASSLEARALEFARAAHEGVGQRRKHTDEPYIVHPVAVAEIVRSVPHSEEMLAAALLHDVVEDTNVGLTEIRDEFGPEVAELVDWLTDVSRPSDGNRRARRKLDLDHLAAAPAQAQTIKFADLIDNSRTIARYDRHFWPVYRREMLALLDALKRGDETLRRRARLAADQ